MKQPEQPPSVHPPVPPFAEGYLIWSVVVFLALVVGSNVGAQWINAHLHLPEFPGFWPFSVLTTRVPTLSQLLLAVALCAGWLAWLPRLGRLGYRLPLVLGTGLLVAVVSTLLQGWGNGFSCPIAGGVVEEQYYHDLYWVGDDIWGFFCNYLDKQRILQTHGRTHPPGPLVVLYFLDLWLRSPALIGAVLGCVATLLMGLSFYKLAESGARDGTAGRLTLLLLLLPAWQIYGIASIDALIAALFTGTLCLFLMSRPAAWVLAGVMLFLASCMTFAVLFLPAVMLCYDAWVRRSVRAFVLASGTALGLHLLLYAVSGFDYLASFTLAARMENRHGFMLWHDPAGYLFTRVECVTEILWLLGPFTALALWGCFRRARSGPAPQLKLALIGMGLLLGMFVTGAFKTGETGRACLFILPCLLLPLASPAVQWTRWRNVPDLLLHAAFVEGVLLQLFGFWFW